MNATAASLLSVVVTTAAGLGLAFLADSGSHTLLGMPRLPMLVFIAFAIQWLAFVPAYATQTEHYYDLTGSLTYLGIMALALYSAPARDPRALLIALLVAIWALRLGSFLFRRVRSAGKDGRFDDIKPNWARFLVAWTLQGLWVSLTLFAALIASDSATPLALDAWALVGLAIWIFGFGFEAVADAQKSAFKADPANRERFITSGLWAWCRHPNYFGEIVLWVGIAVIATPTFSGWQWLGWISPLFVYLLLTRVSGIPMLSERAERRWGDDPEFRRYRDNTPALMPRPPRR